MIYIYPCPFCNEKFSNQSQILKHINEHLPISASRSEQQDTLTQENQQCTSNINQTESDKHINDSQSVNRVTIQPVEFSQSPESPPKSQITSTHQQAFNEKIKVLTIINQSRDEKSYASFLNAMKDFLIEEIEERLKRFTTLKTQLTINSCYVKHVEEKPIEIDAFFTTEYVKVTATTNINELLNKKFEELITRSQEFPAEGSGLTLKVINKLMLTTCLYQPFRGNAFMGLPDVIKKKHAILNPAVHGTDCFKWCIRAFFLNKKLKSELTPKDFRQVDGKLVITEVAEQRIRMKLARMGSHSIQEVESYQLIDWTGVEGAVSLDDVKLFVDNNFDISINVFGLNENNEVIGPLYATEEKQTHHINLLYIQDSDNSTEGHFCWIKSKSRLINAQYRNKKRTKLYICDYCLLILHTEANLTKHLEGDCRRVVTKIPSPNEFVEFKSFSKQLRAPIVVYADFECALAPTLGCANNPDQSRTMKTEQHVPTSFGFYVKCFDESLDRYESYRGEDSAKIFVERLIDCLQELYETYVFGVNIPLIITQEETNFFNQTTICYICEKPFHDDKVKDHCHLTGKTI